MAQNPTAKYAFADLRQALDASEIAAGADTVQIAESTSPIVLNNSAVTSVISDGKINSVTITQPLTILGSGQTKTIITPQADTQFNNGSGPAADALTSVLRVTNQTGKGASLTLQNLTFDGTNRKLGIGITIEDGANGTIDQVTVRNVVFTPTGNTEGTAILGFSAASLKVSKSIVEGYGRVGIQFGNTSGSVTDTVVTGRGAGNLFNSGIDIYGSSNVTVSGNTVTNNLGVVDKFISDGVLAYADPDTTSRVPTVTVIGNTLSNNAYGLAQGLPTTPDGGNVRAEFNNFGDSTTFAIFNQSGNQDIQAPNNFFGDATGPTNPTINPTGKGEPISDRVNIGSPLVGVTPVNSAEDTTIYLNEITTVTTSLTVDPSTAKQPVNGVTKFLVNFSQPVTGFTSNDVTILGGGTPAPTVTVTGSGSSYTIAVANVPSGTPITVQLANQAGRTDAGFLTKSAAVTAAPNPTGITLPTFTAVGTDAGSKPSVAVLNPDGSKRSITAAFDDTITGGVRTTISDLTGDGVPDTVVGTGVGPVNRVRVLDGNTSKEVFNFSPFESTFTLGLYVTSGDVTGDGIGDLIMTPDQGGGPRVVIVRGGDFVQVASFFGIDDILFRGGARAAVGDFSQDNRLDLVVAAGFGGGPRVAVFNGTTVTSGNPVRLFNDFFVFESTLRDGAFVGAGDVNGDGIADLVAGGGPSGGPRVLVLSGSGLVAGQEAKAPQLANFFAGNSSERNGVRVTVKNLDNDNRADIVTGPGPGGGSRVTAYAGSALTPTATTPTTLWQADPFAGLTSGAFVG